MIPPRDAINLYLETARTYMRAELSRRSGIQLRYDVRSTPNLEPLLVDYRPGAAAKPEIPWPTLNSMRNVDSDCNIYVWGEH